MNFYAGVVFVIGRVNYLKDELQPMVFHFLGLTSL